MNDKFLNKLEKILDDRRFDIERDIDFYDTRIVNYEHKGYDYDWELTEDGLQLTVTLKFSYRVVDQECNLHEFNYIGTYKTYSLIYTDIAIEVLGELEEIISRYMIKED